MIRKILTLLTVSLISKVSFSQCAIEPWSLEKRMDLSTLVVEGKIIDQYPFREVGKNAIYTASVIEVYKIFKGTVSSPYYIEIITFGGQIGLERHQANPELELLKDDLGVFLLNENKIVVPDFVKNNGKLKYQGTASVQSFISYDLDENLAFDVSKVFEGISTTLYETLQSLAKNKFNPVKSFGYNAERLKYRPTASPVITSFGGSNANAGTGEILVVNGVNFGNTRGKGRIEFLDANFGDGRRVKTPYPKDYSVWNDTQIKVRIPTRAGTGSIKVATNDSGSFTTINSFTIKFAHLNVGYKSSAQDSAYYTTDLKNDNNKGGYTFQLNPRFKANSERVNSFLRSMETWRCGTLVNWDVGRDTNIKVINGDQVNIVKLTKFTDSKLAVCYSYWNGCFISGTNMEWYVNELDIEADSTINWYYLTGTIGGSQYDFQSVLSHELGHGHQLGHVISTNEMMHFSISNGKKKSTLSTADLSGGKYVMDISVKTNVCNNGGAMKALAQSACGYTKPLSGFKADRTSICPNNTVTFMDTTIGIVKTYSWNFGMGATPATANTKGPHNVAYSNEGTRTVKLFTTNDFGTDSTVKNNYITVMPGKPPTPKNLVYDDSACLGMDTWKVDSFGGTSSLVWQLPTQATGTSSTKNTRTFIWNTVGGPYAFWVRATNSCGSSDSLVGQAIVLNNPTCIFSKVESGRTVTFNNTSQFASSYKWYFGDGDSSALPNPVHIYPMGKAYSATLKSINKCKTASLTLTVNPFHPGGQDKIELLRTLAFPNPTHNILYLSKEVAGYKLMDPTGTLILEGMDNKLDLTLMPKGIYILNTYIFNGDSLFIKVVKD